MPPIDVIERAAALAATQYGLVSLAQFKNYGLSSDQLRRLTASGRIRRVDRAVYRFVGTPDHPRLPLMHLVLRTGGVASHRSCASLLGLIDWQPRPEVTVKVLSNYRLVTRIHRHQDLDPRDVTTIEGIPCTNAARLLIDIGAVRRDLTEPLFHAVLHRQLATYDDIVARFYQVARRGRNGVGPLRAVLEEYDSSMAAAHTPLEVLLLNIIHDHAMKAPVRQHRVVINGRKYFIDVAYPDEMLAIEGDGFGVHSEREQFETDRHRQNELVLHGWRVLRFTWRQIRHQPEYVAATIRAALGEAN
jgi:very-short-patch-repair endonuclease